MIVMLQSIGEIVTVDQSEISMQLMVRVQGQNGCFGGLVSASNEKALHSLWHTISRKANCGI